ncbi:MAG: type II toxin-antitoxin system Phd/YefM family antitoxin [Candidatus Nanopelagicales bacterium]
MKSVDIRELRQQASALLRQVEQGQSVQITDRRRAVAPLSSLPSGSPLEMLRLAGETEPATGTRKIRPAPSILPSEPRRRPPCWLSYGRAGGGDRRAYLDSSTIINLAIPEGESLALRAHLRRGSLC